MQMQLFPTPSMGGLWSTFWSGAYTWTTPQTGGWFSWITNGVNNAFALIASGVNVLDATAMRITIWAVQGLSDPKWLLQPLAIQIGTIMHAGYANIFVRFVPLFFVVAAGFVAYRYARGHHAKMWQNILSIILATALTTSFFTYFGAIFGWINAFGEGVTNTAGTAVAETVGTNFGSMYDAAWDSFVLYPWTYGQFGAYSQTTQQNLSNGLPPSLDVTKAAIGQTFQDSAGNTYTIQTGQNWAGLFLTHSDPSARKNLMSILDTPGQKEFVGQIQPVADSINPFFNWTLAIVDGIFMWVAMIFLGMIAYQLFVREIMFMYMMLAGMVTVPVSFIPEVGWSVTLRWLRGAAEHLIQRTATMLYAVLIMALAGIITQLAMKQGIILLAPIMSGFVYLAGIMYKNKVFGALINPHVDKYVHGKPVQNGQAGQDTRSVEHIQNRQGNGNPGREAEHASGGGGGGRKLQDVFSHPDNAGHAVNRPKSKHLMWDLEIAGTAAATVATGGAAAPLLGEEIAGAAATEGAEVAASKAATSAATHVAERAAQSGTKTLSERAKDFAAQKAKEHGQNLLNKGKDALTDHVKNALDPNAQHTNWHQRAHRRESFERGLEHSAHKLAVRSLHNGGKLALKGAKGVTGIVQDSFRASAAQARVKVEQARVEAERAKLSTAMTTANSAYSIPQSSLDATAKIQAKLSSIRSVKNEQKLGMDAATLADWDTYAQQLSDQAVTDPNSRFYIPTTFDPDRQFPITVNGNTTSDADDTPPMALDADTKAALASAYNVVSLVPPPAPTTPIPPNPSELTDSTRAAMENANRPRQQTNKNGAVSNFSDDGEGRLGGTMSDRFSVMDADTATFSRPETSRSNVENDQTLDTSPVSILGMESDQILPTNDDVQTASNGTDSSQNATAQTIIDVQNVAQNGVTGSAVTDQVIVVRRDADGNAVALTATAPVQVADSSMVTTEQIAQNALNQQQNTVPQPIPTALEQSNVTFINQYRDNATSHGDNQATHTETKQTAQQERATTLEKREKTAASRSRANATVREDTGGYAVNDSSKAAQKRSGTAATRKAATTKSANARKKEQQAKRRTTPGRKQD